MVDLNACSGLVADTDEPVASTYFHVDGEDVLFYCKFCRSTVCGDSTSLKLTLQHPATNCRLIRISLARELVRRQRR